MFDHRIIKPKEFNIPIISVGNITVGGTGKTPHVEYLVKLLKDENNPAVLSRGYKRKTKGFYIAGNYPKPDEIGDEPCQIKKKFPDVTVAVDANRVRGVQKLIEQGIQLIILDDAFQHRYVKPGLSILLVDFNRNINEDYLLPFGRLREGVAAKDRADIMIISKTPPDIKPIDRRIIHKNLYPRPYQKVFFTGLRYGNIKAVFKEAVNNVSLQDLKNGSIVLFTGIAHTKQLLEYLDGFCENIIHLNYPDHANYSLKRINKIIDTFNNVKNTNKIILTTEKDAVKVSELPIEHNIFKQKLFFLPIEVFFIDEERDFNNQIIDYVRKNKGNR
jgi:tetraacyldisaccharide 4'-kinase